MREAKNARRQPGAMESEPAAEIDRAWVEEARRRSEAIRDGAGRRISWEEARASIFARGPERSRDR